MNTRLSSTIDWLRLPLILFIILLHSYTAVKIPDDSYFKCIYLFALWLGETGVPGFFIISGFLFFNSKKTYKQKITTRIHSLLIPYIIWNSIILGMYIFTYIIGFPQAINGKNIAYYTWIDYLRAYWDRGVFDNGNFVPILCPLWYIRNLLILSLISPLIFYLVKYLREVFLILTAIWWMSTPHNAFTSQTIFFFSLGAYFSVINIDPLTILQRHKNIFSILFFSFAIIDIFTHSMFSCSYALQLHRLSIIFNLPFLFILSDYCIHELHIKAIYPNSVFFIYCAHYPICTALRKSMAVICFQNSTTLNIALYFICVCLTIIICVSMYSILNRYFPKIKNILTSGR